MTVKLFVTLFFSLFYFVVPVANALTDYHLETNHQAISHSHGHDHSHSNHHHKDNGSVVLNEDAHTYGESDHNHSFLELNDLYVYSRIINLSESLNSHVYVVSYIDVEYLLNSLLQYELSHFSRYQHKVYWPPGQFRTLPLLS